MTRQRIFNSNQNSRYLTKVYGKQSMLDKYFSILVSHTAILLCLLFWFAPLTNTWCKHIDVAFSRFANTTLILPSIWQLICGWLNHPHESWLNFIIMVSINLAAICMLPRKKRIDGLTIVLYYWLFFQFVLLINHVIFADLLAISRESPSLVLEQFTKLSELLAMPLKDASENCFPAGHTLVAVYWLLFTNIYAPKSIKYIAWGVTPLLILPRLFSGAHWLSDVIFTVVLAYAFFAWAKLALEQFISKHFIVKEFYF